LALWTNIDLSGVQTKFSEFGFLTKSKQKIFNIVVFAILIAAIPVALFSAVAVHNKFIKPLNNVVQ
jgi:hypothetical protein